ncbi:hypothetical protein [Cellulomonas dongxiuzhuiae]|uniref:ASCH domain-containing protein n=1 Tax=Cellulomonas dongxiuzhuiae TaxID=2819979 RepID=A0ABX8GJ60_9CELL|nr:hypothetical protein [Cellulomonas dongxiuzhuiae]MBO3089271.1 hypothetical protein [Cellulomonas dongxiuzhuiae]MBO3094943.1 hypothetical protein [Cellulomonas dongxiuzhuiae]QWC15963.1 hypothetical protein KKR89_17240 [Cellulomonas dongxiuzhuiae]
MLLPPKVAAAVADGTVTLAFRRWQRPDVHPGTRFRTPAGVVEVTSVDVVDPATLTDADAHAAGLPDVAALLRLLDPDAVAKRRRTARYGRSPVAADAPAPDTTAWPVHRVGLAWAGPDPREALRGDADLTDADVAAIDARLDRLDRASTHGPWTVATLDVIRRRPHVRAPDLAAELGRERDPFKIDVRKLKGLGLTQSFDVGYALSPRGEAYLARTRRS